MTLDEMKKVVQNDPETKNLSIADVDVYKIYVYLQDRDQHTVIDGYRPVLKTDPYIEIVYEPTQEKEMELKKSRIRKHLKFYDSEIYIQDASLSRFDVFNEEREKAYRLAIDFVEHYKRDHYMKGLYIYGKYATGKSYLLSAIAQALAERNITVLFVYMPDLVRSIRQGMNEGNMEERINQLKQADVLMMDDVGGENMTPWFRDEVMVPIVQYRLSAKLPVFMTSNYEYVGLVDVMTVTKDETNRVKAARLIQRIKDLMSYVKLTSDQYPDR
ncbi:MAG: ATP-binding protein [Acholeplasmataceae bacterium]|jgi:primosomal protein DnaI|nr:ATP-binding protein [Acholeplasmataceae bacterium]